MRKIDKADVIDSAVDQVEDNIKNDLVEILNRLEMASNSLDGVLLGEGFIISVEDVYLSFDIKDSVVSNPTPCLPDRATRFTKSDAERIAKEVKNGNGMNGEVVHVRDAVKYEINNYHNLLILLTESKEKLDTENNEDIAIKKPAHKM